MTDNFDPDRMFEALRESTRRAPVASAADVRKRGHQRAVRARVIYSTTAVVVLTVGAGAAFAAGQNNAGRDVRPGGETPSVTATTPSPTSVVPTSTTSIAPYQHYPTGAAASSTHTVVTGPLSRRSPSATTTDRPTTAPATTAAVTTAPVTTTPAAPTTTAPAGRTTNPAAQTPSLTIDIVRTPAGATTFVLKVVISGNLPQPYDPVSGAALTGRTDPIGSMDATLDGKATDVGADGGVASCKAKAPVEHAAATLSSSPITVKPGKHTVTVSVRSTCGGLQYVKSFPFTVG